MRTNQFKIFKNILFFLKEKHVAILYNFLNQIKSKKFFYKRGKVLDVAIIDNVFPSVLSPWRSLEYSEICKQYPNSKIYCDLDSFGKYSLGKSIKENIQLLERLFPELKSKIKILSIFNQFNCKVVYFLFYQNINKYFELMIELNLNFVFTLYPGGGFELFNDNLNDRLKEICNNPLCNAVIVNQFITQRHLVDNQLCPIEKINLIHGGPLNIEVLNNSRNEYSKNLNNSLNVLFMANKYSKDGADKGFPIFLDFVKKSKFLCLDLNFVVVGSFNETDVDFEIRKWIEFKGLIPESDFIHLFSNIHLIISPNEPFILKKGAFDGFPLGTCIAAALENVLILATDYFSEGGRINLLDEVHYMKILPFSDDIILKVQNLLEDRNRIKAISVAGREFVTDHYSYKNQIKPRLEIFKKYLN